MKTQSLYPIVTTIPPSVIAWCKLHDWYVTARGNVITVRDDYTQYGQSFTGLKEIVYTTFQDLRNWAGY